MSERRRGLGGRIEPLPEPETQGDGSVIVERGTVTADQKAAYIAREAERHGLTDAQREQWIAAGGHTSWLYEPRWTEDDEDDAPREVSE